MWVFFYGIGSSAPCPNLPPVVSSSLETVQNGPLQAVACIALHLTDTHNMPSPSKKKICLQEGGDAIEEDIILLKQMKYFMRFRVLFSCNSFFLYSGWNFCFYKFLSCLPLWPFLWPQYMSTHMWAQVHTEEIMLHTNFTTSCYYHVFIFITQCSILFHLHIQATFRDQEVWSTCADYMATCHR